MQEHELQRKIRAAIRRDPHVAAICEMLGVSIAEFLDGLDPAVRARSELEEDLVEGNQRSAKALTAIGA